MQRSAHGITIFVHFATLGKVMLPRNGECHKSLWHPVESVCLALVKPLPLSRRVNDRNKEQDRDSEMRLMPTKSRVLPKLILYAASQSDLISFRTERSKLRLPSRMFVSRYCTAEQQQRDNGSENSNS
jgi:hypothetical protein